MEDELISKLLMKQHLVTKNIIKGKITGTYDYWEKIEVRKLVKIFDNTVFDQCRVDKK